MILTKCQKCPLADCISGVVTTGKPHRPSQAISLETLHVFLDPLLATGTVETDV